MPLYRMLTRRPFYSSLPSFSFNTVRVNCRLFGSSSIRCCRCVNCSKALDRGTGLIKCNICGSFQPAPPTTAGTHCCPDFYRLLTSPTTDSSTLVTEEPKFGIDLKELKNQYLKLQSIVHPDRIGESKRTLGEAWSSWINRAHETLKSPLQRAIYLVNYYEEDYKNDAKNTINIEKTTQHNEDISETPSSSDSSHDISLVLQIREELDDDPDPATLSAIKTENDERIKKCCDEIKELLDCRSGERRDLSRVKWWINQLRYWISIDNEIKEKFL